MRGVTLAAFILAATAAMAGAEDVPAPEECLAKSNSASAVMVTQGGKTYRMANEACRAQFLTDPERYAQLYDALLELEAEGTPLRAPASPSLVPS
jgi:YHS domain-containing protein